MNTLVIFYSKFGNTQQVAEAIAEVLATAGTVRTISSDQLDTSVLKDVDLVVMGVPTHKMKLPEAVLPVLEVLPKEALRGVPVAAFDTSYKMSAWLARMTAGRKLVKKLRKLGGKRIVPPESFLVKDKEGPLFDSEIERAEAWAASILERLQIDDQSA